MHATIFHYILIHLIVLTILYAKYELQITKLLILWFSPTCRNLILMSLRSKYSHQHFVIYATCFCHIHMRTGNVTVSYSKWSLRFHSYYVGHLPGRYGALSGCGWRGRLLIKRRAAKNIMNKQSQTADGRRSPSLKVGREKFIAIKCELLLYQMSN